MKVIFLVGPTASGKSALALSLAKKFNGAILNSDSVQVYQGLTIGSAAPTLAEKQEIPHFFFQEIPAPRKITAADYARRAHEILKENEKKFPVIFVVGGTGFYLQALEKGMLPIEKADSEIQSELEKALARGEQAKLHQDLLRLDPVVGGRISANDHYRLVRALEICLRTGRPMSQIEREHREQGVPFPYELMKIGIQPDRPTLLLNVRRRTEKMLESGLVDEVQTLLGLGFRDWEPLQSVGYKETLAHLEKDPELPTISALEERVIQNTMRLTKKQKTWFQRDPDIIWNEGPSADFFTGHVVKFLNS